jgi:hypothetical protein
MCPVCKKKVVALFQEPRECWACLIKRSNGKEYEQQQVDTLTSSPTSTKIKAGDTIS